MEFAEKLKKIREVLQINQKDFAEKLNITQVSISRYESGHRIADINFAKKLIDIFNVNPVWLFLDIGKPISDIEDFSLSDENLSILKDLQLLLTEQELNEKLDSLLIETILKKFEVEPASQSMLYRFLLSIKLEGHLPIRPYLFLYYVFRFIAQDTSKPTENFKGYILDIILSFKTLSWQNHPVFTKKIKAEISAKFNEEIKETECSVLVRKAKITLSKLEENIPKGVLNYHKKRELQSLFR